MKKWESCYTVQNIHNYLQKQQQKNEATAIVRLHLCIVQSVKFIITGVGVG
jgi:hypothetical protein